MANAKSMTPRSDGEAFLQAFHARHPGCTSQSMAQAVTVGGHSSYDLLARVVPEHVEGFTVLDLACGDGFLLDKLLGRHQPGMRLIGVDMSSDELSAATERLGDAPVTLLRARAQTLPVPDASVDFVLCHMALMLFDAVEDAIAEVRRVLEPGGTFSAIVGAASGDGMRPPSSAAFVTLLEDALNGEGLSLRSRLGDPRVRKDEGIRALFNESSGFASDVEITDHLLVLDISVAEALKYFMLTYDPALLSPNALANFERRLRSSLEGLADPRGLVACPTAVRQIVATRLA